MKLRVIPLGNNISRMALLRAKQVQFAGEGGDLYFAGEGLDNYATRAWGPQGMTFVWAASHPGVIGWVRATSDIKTNYDLKGKRCVYIPGSIVSKQVEAALAFGGLTWDDVEKVTFPSYADSMQAVIDGSADFCSGSTTATKAYELEASPYGIRFLEMPASDKEGWARANKVMPMWVPFKSTVGAGVTADKPVECGTYGYPGFVCYPEDISDDLAYFMTKAVHESYPIVAKAAKNMEISWPLEKNLYLFETSNLVTFHPGSIRYLKEIGKWKAGYDELQAGRIAHQKAMRKLWDEVTEKALDDGIKDKDFPEYWLKARDEAYAQGRLVTPK